MTYVPKKTSSKILHECYSLAAISSLSVSVVAGILVRDFVAGILVFSITSYFMSLVQLVTMPRYKEYAFISIGSKVCQIPLSLALYYWLGLDGFILGYTISNLIFGYRFFIGLRNFSLKFNEIRSIWRFVAQVYGANTSYTLLSYLDKIVVGNFFGYYVLGSYQLSFQVYTFLSILPVTLFNYLLPRQAGGLTKKSIKILGLGIICGIVILVFFLTPVTVPYFLPSYSHTIRSIQIIIFAIVPLTFVSFLRANILAQGEGTRSMLFAGLISLITEIISIIALGSLFGVDGISSALVFTMSLECIILLFANKGRIF